MSNHRNSTENFNSIGKLPPQALELEEAILGALMIEKSAIEIVEDILKPESFYKDSHQLIYKAILSLINMSQPVDILTVSTQLRKDETLEICGGPYFITQLTNRVASAANIEFHSRIVQQKFIQRELIRLSSSIQTSAYEDSAEVFDLIDEHLLQVSNLLSDVGLEDKFWADQLKASVHQLEQTDRSTGINGIPSGLIEIDNITHGFQNSDLIILAARPSMGKTTLAIQMALNAAKEGYPVDLYSLEMVDMQIIYKMISADADVPLEDLKHAELTHYDWKKINDSVHRLKQLPFYLNDKAAIKAMHLYRSIGRGIKKRGTKIVFVDYLQLIDGITEKSGNREREIGFIAQTLKKAAKDFNIPIIALCQLSRAVETRGGNKIPMLSDLRESGTIEQDADVVAFLYRPEYYGFLFDDDGNSLAGIAKIIFAKHRNGKTGEAKIKFKNYLSKFENLSTNSIFE